MKAQLTLFSFAYTHTDNFEYISEGGGGGVSPAVAGAAGGVRTRTCVHTFDICPGRWIVSFGYLGVVHHASRQQAS